MKLIGIARLGKDAEVKFTPNGKAVSNLSLAYSFGQKSSEGKRQTQWVEAALWGDQAERLQPHLLKGTVLNVTCRDVHIETYESRDGQGFKLCGTVADIEFVPKQRDEGGQPQTPQRSSSQPQRPATPPQKAAGFDDFDDDIPF